MLLMKPCPRRLFTVPMPMLVCATAAFAQLKPDTKFEPIVTVPAHTGRHPRVMFDLAHHNVVTPGTSYMAFAKLLAKDGCKLSVNRTKFTKSSLKECDVLVIGAALGNKGLRNVGSEQPAFTDEECDAVLAFVRAGGSLLLVTDGFPCGFANQRLADRFKVKMTKGSTIRDRTYWRDDGTVCDHPINRGRDKSEEVRSVQSYTGQTLEGPVGAKVLLKMPEGAKELVRDEKDPLHGMPTTIDVSGRAMALAFEEGKGRVVVLGEAAMIGAEVNGDQKVGINDLDRDNVKFALNIVRWLTRVL